MDKAPDWIRSKWQQIQELKGRNRDKNKQKMEFTAKLLASNGTYSDAYYFRDKWSGFDRADSESAWFVLSLKTKNETNGFRISLIITRPLSFEVLAEIGERRLH